jgi:hypothetical protein
MRELPLLVVVLVALIAEAAAAFRPPETGGGIPNGASRSQSGETALAKAFRDATDETRHLLWGNPDPRKRPAASEWGRAAQIRAIAEKLAKEHGKAIGEYLRDTYPPAIAANPQPDKWALETGTPDSLALVTLDTLGMHEEAARLALRLIAEKRRTILLNVSFCSPSTREAAANLLVPEYAALHLKCVQAQIKWNMDWQEPVVQFAGVVGNAKTEALLSAASAEAERCQRGWGRDYEQAAERIALRLSLPADRQAQRAKDELLFWQAGPRRPPPRNLRAGRIARVRQMRDSGLSISKSYLIERLDKLGERKIMPGYSPYDPFDNLDDNALLFAIIASQKQREVIPAMVRLAKRRPEFRSAVEDTLKDMGGVEADKALSELGKN